MSSYIKTIKSYLLMILKYVLAIGFYLIVMNYLGSIIIIPLLKSVLDIDNLNLIQMCFGAPMNFINEYYKVSMGVINATLQFSIYFLLFVGLFLILLKEIDNDITDYKNNRDERERSLLVSLGIYFVINMITGLLVILLTKVLDVNVISQNQANLEAIASTSMFSYLILGVTVVVMGPLVEELIFRKSIFKIIPNDYAAIIVSSVLFGLMHTISFDYSWKELLVVTLPYLSSGVAFGICYKLSRHNIMIPYLLHAGLNLFSLFMMLY